jgi:hypothetical protein
MISLRSKNLSDARKLRKGAKILLREKCTFTFSHELLALFTELFMNFLLIIEFLIYFYRMQKMNDHLNDMDLHRMNHQLLLKIMIQSNHRNVKHQQQYQITTNNRVIENIQRTNITNSMKVHHQ